MLGKEEKRILKGLINEVAHHDKNTATFEMGAIIDQIWDKVQTGVVALLHTSDMNPGVPEVWESFKNGETDYEGLKIRLSIIKPESLIMTLKYC